jgi:small acid-soluble spore protein D (minor alpha/beta-type SASP)
MIKSKNRRTIIAETAKASQIKIEIKKRSIKQEIKIMASNKTLVPEAKEALEKFKMEAASEVGVNLTQGYNGDLTSRQAGSVGGQMVKKMIESYENSIKNNK